MVDDALELTIFPFIDIKKVYPEGSFARHQGDLWRAVGDTEGWCGWERLVNGVAEVEISQASEFSSGVSTLRNKSTGG